MLAPLVAVVASPARRVLVTPVTPMTRWLVVVAHRDPQQGRGDELGRHGDPGTVVARAHVPTPADEGVALPVVLKDIGWRSGRVVDGEGWDDGPMRPARPVYCRVLRDLAP